MRSNIQEKIRLLFLGGQDTTTSDGRAKERARRIAQTSASAIVARVINILSGLITIPLTLPYFGVELFGIWMTLTGFVALLSFADLGLGIGLQSELTKCYAKNNKITPSKLIASAFFVIFMIMFILISFSLFILPELDLAELIKISEPGNEQVLVELTQCILLVFALGLPSGIIQRILIAYQDGLILNIALIVGRCIGLGGIFLCIYFEKSIIFVSAVYMASPFFSIALSGVYLFWTKSWLRPNFFSVNVAMLRSILSVGGLALSAQIGGSIMSTGPLLVLSSQYGAIAVVPYILAQRLMSIVQMIISVGMTPLWPAYGEANIRGDYNWIKSTFYKSLKLSMGIALFSFFSFMIFGQAVISIWADNSEAIPNLQLIFACSIVMIIGAWTSAFAVFLNGFNHFKGQATYGLILPIVTILLGMSFSEDLGFILTLWLFILLGELVRLILMAFESYVVMKKLN